MVGIPLPLFEPGECSQCGEQGVIRMECGSRKVILVSKEGIVIFINFAISLYDYFCSMRFLNILKVALIYTRQVFGAYLAIAPERRRMKSI